jgi:hypothetical protein
MQDNVIVASGWVREAAREQPRGADAEAALRSLPCVCLFCLLGLLVTAALLLSSSPETVAAVTAAMMM